LRVEHGVNGIAEALGAVTARGKMLRPLASVVIYTNIAISMEDVSIDRIFQLV
jgi:hypothetical protein